MLYFKSSNPQILKSSNPQILKSSNPQILKSSNPQILKSWFTGISAIVLLGAATVASATVSSVHSDGSSLTPSVRPQYLSVTLTNIVQSSTLTGQWVGAIVPSSANTDERFLGAFTLGGLENGHDYVVTAVTATGDDRSAFTAPSANTGFSIGVADAFLVSKGKIRLSVGDDSPAAYLNLYRPSGIITPGITTINVAVIDYHS